MITFDVSKLQASLEKAEQQIKQRLEQMVRGFSYSVVFTATEATPLGSYTSFPDLYEARLDPGNGAYGLRPYHGFARGSWRVDNNSELKIQEYYGSTSSAKAQDQAKIDLMDFKLGDDVMISNFGPYIQQLENNHSPLTQGNGIMKPTMYQIEGVIQHKLKMHYDKPITK
jgi:hypothetical protein